MISDKVSTSLDMLINVQDYYDENQRLKEQLTRIYSDIIDYDALKRENEQLREQLELEVEYEEYEFAPPCAIIARNVNDPYGSFTIDRGSDHGISPQDPVVTRGGVLVGVCYDVSSSTSRVMTVYSPKTVVGVTVVRSKAFGVMEGGYDLLESGYCKMSYIEKEADIIEGDIVLTTGSEVFPPGHLVGTVVEVGIEDSGLSKYAVIEPLFSNTDGITSVNTITGFKGQGINDDEY
jgi:rod shape-determining protein MreC